LWIFHTIPGPGEFGNETWERESWSYTGNTGVWGQISADEQLGLVYLPVETPTGDYFGGERPGSNLFGESLVAVDLRTGKREWHSPTQPFPTRPPAYDRQGVSVDDLIDFTPELRAEAVKLVSRYQIGPLFTPPVVSKAEGPIATLILPSAGGGTNWPGGSYDP